MTYNSRRCTPLVIIGEMIPMLYIFIYISARSPLEKTRYDTSLGLLTKKFVGLLRNATDGVCIFYFMLAKAVQFMYQLTLWNHLVYIQTSGKSEDPLRFKV